MILPGPHITVTASRAWNDQSFLLPMTRNECWQIRRWRPAVLVALGVELLLAAWLPGLTARLTLLVLLGGSALLLRQLNRWERQLWRGDGHPPRNAL